MARLDALAEVGEDRRRGERALLKNGLAVAAVVAAFASAAACGERDQRSGETSQGQAGGSAGAQPPKQTQRPGRDFSAQAKRAVRNYYATLNRGDFELAWDRLAGSVQTRFGGFHTWRAGYDFTEGTDVVSASAISTSARRARVRVELESEDLDACGDRIRQSFAGSWFLERRAGRWIAVDADIEKTGGRDPVRSVGACSGYQKVEPPPDYELPQGFTEDGLGYSPPPSFCETHDCIPNFPNGTGYPVQCSDGTWSGSGGRQGACSWHGGVADP